MDPIITIPIVGLITFWAIMKKVAPDGKPISVFTVDEFGHTVEHKMSTREFFLRSKMN